ncbi:unnamed protein product [Blepharisma stoltei]|uniref:Fumarylacetoacetase-like C-terminal domain-containing protein n=1 Tax=Blepharisma stoltei TaxID=1481888 RepID=A0AAU9KD89_9CILI|nr:unnamed protein product [Blepharisma stoltei]
MEALYRELFVNSGRKVLAIAKNYFEHAIEMNATGVPPKPIIFQKPLTSVISEGESIVIPEGVEVHHEIELGVMIAKRGKNIAQSEVEEFIAGYFVALDMTARNVQAEAKANSWPWDVAKGYDTFLPLSSFIPKEAVQDPYALELELLINGETKQRGMTGSMHYKIDQIVSYLSNIMTLCPGDIILTGTPSGVGPIHHGDVLDCICRQSGNELVRARFNVA